MEEYSVNATTGKKCATVPPIIIHSGTPCPPPLMPSTSSHACILPPISPQASLLSGNAHYPIQGDTGQVKQENYVQASSCMFSNSHGIAAKHPPSNIHLVPNQRPPNRISPLASSGIQHLQLPHNRLQSPLLFDLSPPHPTSKRIHTFFDGNSRLEEIKGKIKTEVPAGVQRLPPLSGYTSGSNLDIDDAFSPLVPPINSLSPYIGSGISGSGISEIPSFPSILASPINSAHFSRKRALSSSPLSDMFDVYAFRSSPNSLMATLYSNASNPLTPNGPIPMGSNSTVGHLIGQSNTPLQAMQYRVQQRKTSIERNQNNDGTTNTTITNQVTFSENPSSEGKADLKSTRSEPMETDTSSGHSSTLPKGRDEDPIDPHICLWEGCGLNFDDLDELVQHIENVHIEKGKADEYICLWQSCIRSCKPFNARYKLLIHMRIHSGEKPNKCTVSLSSVCVCVAPAGPA